MRWSADFVRPKPLLELGVGLTGQLHGAPNQRVIADDAVCVGSSDAISSMKRAPSKMGSTSVPEPVSRGVYGRVRAAFKKALACVYPIIEFCHDCGITQPVVWHAHDWLWERVTGSPYGVLCPACFDRRAFRLGFLLKWKPRVETVFPVQDES